MERLLKILKAAENGDEKRVMQVFQKHHGVAYRACFSDSLFDYGWASVVKSNRNNLGLLKSSKGKIIEPFKGYRKDISYAVSKINKPGFYFVLDWGIIPKQNQLNGFREVIKKFSERKKEICLLGLKRLGVWLVLVGGGGISFKAKPNSIDKKYFEEIYDEDSIEIDIDIHSHDSDLDISFEDRESAKGEDIPTSFFVVTYQDGFAPFTSRGRVRDSKKQKIVIPWSKIKKEFYEIRGKTHCILD